MITHGQAPYLECSSKGDKRFSAFYAEVHNSTIEKLYQSHKIFEGGITNLSPKEAKGRKAINAHQGSLYYSYLWDTYIALNPELWETLRMATGLSDIFGQPNHQCQASELWRIKNGWLKYI